MRQDAVARDVKSVGIDTSLGTRFGMAQTPKMYRIMTQKLYSNKFRAICRELGCNASDSHKKAGRPHLQFDVHIPTLLDPHFSIRDYGTGISPEMIDTVYTKYGVSTKEDTDEEEGNLGLGSKTPMIYSDAFSATSWHGGWRREYAIFMDSDDYPRLIMVSEEESDEPSGFMVKIPIKTQDHAQFNSDLKETYSWFIVPPRIVNSSEKLVSLQRPERWWNSHNSESFVIYGNVLYPIDKSELTARSPVFVQKMLDKGIILRVPIGELSVTPSREGFEYNQRTIDNLVFYIRAAFADVLERISNAGAWEPDPWKSRSMKISSYNSEFRISSNKNKSIYNKSITSGNWASFIDPKLGSGEWDCHRSYRVPYGKTVRIYDDTVRSYTDGSAFVISFLQNIAVIINDGKSRAGIKAMTQHFFERAIMIPNDADLFIDLMETIGNPPCMTLTELREKYNKEVPVQKKKTAPKKEKSDYIKGVRLLKYNYSITSTAVRSGSVKTNGLIVHGNMTAKSIEIQGEPHSFYSVYDKTSCMLSHIINHAKPVYVYYDDTPPTELSGMQTLDQYLESFIDENSRGFALAESDSNDLKFIFNVVTDSDPKEIEHLRGSMMFELLEIMKSYYDQSIETIPRYVLDFVSSNESLRKRYLKKIEEFNQFISMISEMYPLMEFMAQPSRTRYITREQRDRFYKGLSTYVNTIEMESENV